MPKIPELLKWDHRFLALADHVAQWSKDPSTKVGAVIVDGQRRVRGLGYNGFPRGVDDLPERLNDRPTKYAFVVHAEANAILSAGRVEYCTIYTSPLCPCQDCAKLIIQAGITRVVTVKPADAARWAESFENAGAMFREANVTVEFIDV